MTIDVIIPAWRPGDEFVEVLTRLSAQTIRPSSIMVINTEEKYWNREWEKRFPLLTVQHINKEEFDHGGTRRMAAESSGADILVFMTQDAVPCRKDLLEKLTAPIMKERVIAAAYARQRPKKGCSVIERYTRDFNYPAVSHVRHMEDIPEHGIKTFFCSDVCAAYRRSSYMASGGFTEHAIFNEDMIMACSLMQAGYGVAYVAEACVYHSHDYTFSEQFHRNFDIGVSQAEHPEVFGYVRSEREGIRLVKQTADHLAMHGNAGQIPRLLLLSAAKYTGYSLGRKFRSLPRSVIMFCTMNKEYWKETHK
ncbi:MAG: glycosyltransferase [Blautia sp.]|nr:glycosyltransferase [Blautia sp.]